MEKKIKELLRRNLVDIIIISVVILIHIGGVIFFICRGGK